MASNTSTSHGEPTRYGQEDPCSFSESDVEITGSTTKQFCFNPVQGDVAMFLCKQLGIPGKERSVLYTDKEGLGTPCERVHILGDGNCFFRAVSYAVCGSEEHHGKIRAAVIKQLKNKPSLYKSVLRQGHSSVEEYVTVSKMNESGTWATEVEIQALSDFFGLGVYTYMDNRWLKYNCSTLPLTDQGIYLENRRRHYVAVVCVKKPGMHSCYNHCQRTAGTTESLSPDSTWHKTWREDDDDDRSEAPVHGRCFGHNDTETKDLFCDTDFTEHKADTQRMDSLAEIGQMEWSLLHRSWHSFMDWLNERWWGSVSKYEAVSYLKNPKRSSGSTIVAACWEDVPGGVCSIAIKTAFSKVQTLTVFLQGGRYVCTDVVDGEFYNPLFIITQLKNDTSPIFHMLPRPRNIVDDPDYFSVAHILTELSCCVAELGDAWWGAWYGHHNTSIQHRMILGCLRNNSFVNTGTVLHYLDSWHPGYLFEVVTAQGKRFKLNFDRSGFTFGNGAYFRTLSSALLHIRTSENITFVSQSYGDQS